MSLSLPADLEPHTDEFDSAGIYALDITTPANLEKEWDRRYDTRAEWFERLTEAEHVIYVGATDNLISRLEDHRDGRVRKAVLPTLAADFNLRNAWPQASAEDAFEQEWAIATRLRQHLPETYFVRQS